MTKQGFDVMWFRWQVSERGLSVPPPPPKKKVYLGDKLQNRGAGVFWLQMVHNLIVHPSQLSLLHRLCELCWRSLHWSLPNSPFLLLSSTNCSHPTNTEPKNFHTGWNKDYSVGYAVVGNGGKVKRKHNIEGAKISANIINWAYEVGYSQLNSRG